MKKLIIILGILLIANTLFARDFGPVSRRGQWKRDSVNEIISPVNINDTASMATVIVSNDLTVLSGTVVAPTVRATTLRTENYIFPESAGSDNQILKYDGSTIGWEADAGGAGGGDSVTVNSTAVDTTANFLDGTDITWTITDGGAGGPDDIDGQVADIFVKNDVADTMLGQLTITEAGNALDVQNTTDATPNQVAIFKSGNRATPTNNDAGYFCFSSDDDNGTQAEFARMTWFALDVTNDSKDGALRFDVMRNNSLIELLYLSTNSYVINNDGNDINFNLQGANDANLLWCDAGLDTITVGSNTSLGKFGIDGDADEIQLLVQGNATQTTSLAVFENSAGTDQMTLSNAGVLNVVGSITEGGNAVPNATDNLSVFASTTSAQLYGVLSNETGSASGTPLAVFNVNPTLTGATMDGDIQLGETDIKLDAVLSADEKWSGTVISGTSGVTTLAVGDLCYLNANDSRWELVDANLSDGYDKMLGICVLAAADNVATEMLVYGKVRSAAFPAFTVGSAVYISETAGDCTQTKPTTTDVGIRIIGYAITAEDLFFNPDNIYYTPT